MDGNSEPNNESDPVNSSAAQNGIPNRCSHCDAKVIVDPGPLFGDASCGSCQGKLWFLNLRPEIAYIFAKEGSDGIRKQVATIAARRLETTPDLLIERAVAGEDVLTTDSLTTLELVLEVEKSLDLKVK